MVRRMKAAAIGAPVLAVLTACAGAAPPPPAPAAPAATAAAGAPEPAAALASDAGTNAPRDAAPDVPVARNDAAAPATEGSLSKSACNEQPPQPFLIRGNFLKVPDGNARAIQYRTDTYGHFPGFGRAPPSAKAPLASVVTTTFMGLPVRMHRKVVPALRCVEEEITAACADHPYKARALAGVRMHNTYRGGEVTNHIFGIAIDIDPDINTCCGCVKPWSNSPLCRRPARTEYDRMKMPECWVHAFERFGFYWLGHDTLRDTMHFEFLGDPDRILKAGAAGRDGGV
jgi:hypothetical protein